jgi:ferric-dicitrate binding protein FerR (iron transport regulator)
VDTLQTLFQAAIADMFQAAKQEAPAWAILVRRVSSADGSCDPTELCKRWHTQRQETMRLFERQRALAQAIREAGGTPSVQGRGCPSVMAPGG